MESGRVQREAAVHRRIGLIDQFATDLRDATVVALYLLPVLNLKLRPKLLREFDPGSRIVSQSFDMGDWKPAVRKKVEGKDVYLWHVPGE